MQACAYDPDVVNHYTVMLYPIVHRMVGTRLRTRWRTLQAHWQPWWTRLDDNELTHALEGTGFFLPYVQSLLFPELCHLQREPTGKKFANWRALIRRMSSQGLVAFTDALPPETVVRLTLSADLHDRIADFDIKHTISFAGRSLGQGKTPARFEWIDAILFPSGLGFLMLKARLTESQCLLSQTIQLNRALQFVHPPSLNFQLPTLRFRSTGEEMHFRDLLDLLTQGLTAPPPEDDEIRTDRLLALAQRASYTDSETGRAYGERCFKLSYACCRFYEEEFQHVPAGAFPDGESRLLFEVASNIPLGESADNPMWIPTAKQAEKFTRDYTLAPWRCWKAMALKDSLVFLATEDIAFTRKSLAGTIEHDYLPLYAYALYQRFQLSVFTNDLMREVALVDEHLRGAKDLLKRFVTFRNRFLFSEVTCKPQGTELYRLLHRGLEIDSLSKMVTESVKEAKEYYQEQWDRQVELAIKAVGFVAGPLVAGYGAFRYFLSSVGPLTLALAIVAALGLTSAALLLLLLLRPKKSWKLPPPLLGEIPSADETPSQAAPPNMAA